MSNAFGTFSQLESKQGKTGYYSLAKLEKDGIGPVSRLPFSLRILVENLLRNCDGNVIKEEDVQVLANWDVKSGQSREIAYNPARVILQDFTGVPAVVDLAALRSAMDRLGGSPSRINPQIPVDLVIDHSVQIDKFGSKEALAFNVEKEFERNYERYQFLRWGQESFVNFRVVPPATGIIHQVQEPVLPACTAQGIYSLIVHREKSHSRPVLGGHVSKQRPVRQR